MRSEADLATQLDKIIPVAIEACDPPLQFRLLQMGRLDDDNALYKVLDAVAKKVGREPREDEERVVALRSAWEVENSTAAMAELPLAEPVKRENEKVPDWSASSELAMLDEIYSRRAQRIEGGHRIIFGVAGSGKTVLLIARAKALAADPVKRVLVLCFNRALATYLRSMLSQSNVKVSHFHAWAAEYCRARYDDDAEAFGNASLARITDQERYDAVLVDEGQDFAPSWFKCAKAALRNPESGDLLIAYDGAQSLYAQRRFTWASVGINARGRSYSRNLNLHLNYRNTREILLAAAPFCHPLDDGEDEASGLRVDPDCAVRLGPRPNLICADTRVAECKLVQDQIRELLRQGVVASDVAVIYPRVVEGLRRVAYANEQALRQAGGVVHIKSGMDFDINAPGIRLLNCQQAKGLQFPYVFLIWADLFGGFENDRQLLYVGLTRAEHTLTISYKQPPVSDASLNELKPHCQ